MIDLIDTFIRPLNERGIRYFITGSVASMVSESESEINMDTLRPYLDQLGLKSQWQAALDLVAR